VTSNGGLLDYEIYRIPRFLENQVTEGREVVNFTPQKYFLVLISVTGAYPKARVQLVGLDKLKQFRS
jgi:hypothetical protein